MVDSFNWLRHKYLQNSIHHRMDQLPPPFRDCIGFLLHDRLFREISAPELNSHFSICNDRLPGVEETTLSQVLYECTKMTAVEVP